MTWTGKINGVTNPAKVNGILVANISKIFGIEGAAVGAEINNIQYGEIDIDGTGLTSDVTITAVVLANSILIWLGSNGNSSEVSRCVALLKFIDTTTIRAHKAEGFADDVLNVRFCVAEFSSGVKSVHNGSINIPTNTASADATIAAVDVSKSILLFTGFNTAQNSAVGYRQQPKLELVNSTTIRATRYNISGAQYVGYSLLEFE